MKRIITWYMRYFSYVIKHRRYIRKISKTMWMYRKVLFHDLSKFHPAEYKYYMRFFSLWDKNIEKEFNVAWNRHQNINKHHYQYWVLIEDNGSMIVLDMPERYIKEMLCDRRAVWYWFSINKEEFLTDPRKEVSERYRKNKTN